MINAITVIAEENGKSYKYKIGMERGLTEVEWRQLQRCEKIAELLRYLDSLGVVNRALGWVS